MGMGMEEATTYRRPRARRWPRTTPQRVADQDLHLWPAYAHTCTTCGWPIDRWTYPTHPSCDPKDTP